MSASKNSRDHFARYPGQALCFERAFVTSERTGKASADIEPYTNPLAYTLAILVFAGETENLCKTCQKLLKLAGVDARPNESDP